MLDFARDRMAPAEAKIHKETNCFKTDMSLEPSLPTLADISHQHRKPKGSVTMQAATMNRLTRGIAEFCVLVRDRCVAQAAAVGDRIAARIAEHFRVSRAVSELLALDDRLLRDIGISRYDIPDASGGRRLRHPADAVF